MAKTKAQDEALAKAAQDKLKSMDKSKVEIEDEDESEDKPESTKGLSDLFRVLADLLKD